MPSSPVIIFTFGHSRHALEHFLDILLKHEIQLVIDVRRRPASRHVPHFHRQKLAAALSAQGLHYVFAGEELGGKLQELEAYFSDGTLNPAWLKSRPGFQEGLKMVLAQARQQRVCLLCSEGDPARCHRATILAPELTAHGAQVLHILPDGSLLAHEKLSLIGRLRQKRLF